MSYSIVMPGTTVVNCEYKGNTDRKGNISGCTVYFDDDSITIITSEHKKIELVNGTTVFIDGLKYSDDECLACKEERLQLQNSQTQSQLQNSQLQFTPTPLPVINEE